MCSVLRYSALVFLLNEAKKISVNVIHHRAKNRTWNFTSTSWIVCHSTVAVSDRKYKYNSQVLDILQSTNQCICLRFGYSPSCFILQYMELTFSPFSKSKQYEGAKQNQNNLRDRLWATLRFSFSGCRGSFSGVKRLVHVDHLHLSNAEVKNKRCYASTPPIRLHGVEQEILKRQ